MFKNFLNNNNNNNSNLTDAQIDKLRFFTYSEKTMLKKNKSIKPFNLVNKKLKNVNLSLLKPAPLQLGFFNAIVNKDFDKKTRIDLISIFNKKPVGKTKIDGSSLSIEIKSLKLYYGQFKVGAEHSPKGIFGSVNNKTNYFMVQIAAHVYDGDANQGITFRIYKNGKIHFSGGILNNNVTQPEKIRTYIVNNYTNKESFLRNEINYNNTVGQFNVNGAINLMGVARAFARSGKVEYEPELRAALKMERYGKVYQLFTTGVIQLMGIKNDRNMLRAHNDALMFAQELYVLGFITLSNAPVKKIVKKKQKVVVNTKKDISEVSWNNKKGELKVSKRQCIRVPKPELVAIAKKMGIVDIKSTTSRAVICERIKRKKFDAFNIDGKPCRAFKREDLIKIAGEKGLVIKNTDTIDTICKKIAKPEQEAAKKAAAKKKVTPVIDPKTLEKRRLTNKTIKENLEKLYGKRWIKKYETVMPSLDNNTNEIKKTINALNLKKNKKGLPFKKDVDALKKNMVKSWKMSRKFGLNQKLNQANNNFAKELENLFDISPPKPLGGGAKAKVEIL